MSGLIKWPGGTSIRSQLIVLFLAIIRTAFIPYFMFCNLAPTDRSLEVIQFSAKKNIKTLYGTNNL